MAANSNLKHNFLSPIEFRFVIKRLPYTEFFVQSTNIPGLSGNPVPVGTPFKPTYFQGDRLDYGDLTLNVAVDENMNNWLEIHNWMVGLLFPDEFDQFANLEEGDGLFSDASLIMMTNSRNPNVRISFKDIFPISLGDIQLDTKSGDIDYATCDITFKTNGFTVSTTT